MPELDVGGGAPASEVDPRSADEAIATDGSDPQRGVFDGKTQQPSLGVGLQIPTDELPVDAGIVIGDGFGDAAVTTVACAPAGFVANNTDCDDTAAGTYPGAARAESLVLCMKDADDDDYDWPGELK